MRLSCPVVDVIVDVEGLPEGERADGDTRAVARTVRVSAQTPCLMTTVAGVEVATAAVS